MMAQGSQAMLSLRCWRGRCSTYSLW